MPSVSRHQHAFMAMSSSAFGREALRRHGHEPAPVEVAKEFLGADKGKKFPDYAGKAYGAHPGDHGYKGKDC
jgi:hypothetical protein